LGHLTEADHKLVAAVNGKIIEYISSLEQVHLRDGLRIFLEVSALGMCWLMVAMMRDNGQRALS